MKTRKDQMFMPNENYRLEDRVLFEAAAAEVAAAADQMAEQTAEQAAAESAGGDAENFDTESLEGDFAESAAALDAIAPADVSEGIPAELPETETMTIDLLGNGDTALSAGRELVIVNSTVMDKDSILNTLAPHQEVLILDGESDAMAQIQSYLDSAEGKFDALHFVTHGDDGYIRLGDEVCNAENFNAADWQAIGDHLTQGGDILIYGCDLAETAAGKEFAAMIAEASGADVAASTDTTGAGGNWDLEFSTGAVETAAVSAGDYGYSLASGKVLLVNGDTTVAYDTIQEAITAATDTDTATEYTIKFDTALFTEEADLVFTEFLQTTKGGVNITIDGSLGELDLDEDGKADRVILDGEGKNRIFQNTQGTVTLTLKNLVFRDGYTEGNGGAVYFNNNSGKLLLDTVTFTGNEGYDGGAVYSTSAVTLNNVEFDGNTATRNGAALYNTNNISSNGTVVFKNNSAVLGGGIYYTGTAGITLSDMTFTGNTASNSGGGIYATKALILENNTFTDNEADCKGGAVYIAADLTVAEGNTFTGNKVISGGAAGAQYQIGGGAIFGNYLVLFQGENNFTGNGVGKEGVLVNSCGQGGVIRGMTVTVDAGAVLNIKDSSIIHSYSALGYTKGTHFDAFSGGVIYAGGTLNMNGTESSRAVLNITNTEMIVAPGEKVETDNAHSQYNLNGGGIFATKTNTAYADILIDTLSVTISNKGDVQYRKMASLAGAGIYLSDASTFDHTNLTFQNIHATAEASAATANNATVRGVMFFASRPNTHTGTNSNFIFKDNSATARSESGSTASVYGVGISTMNHDVQTIDFSENNTFLFENNRVYAETTGTVNTNGADIYIMGQKKTVLISNATFIAATDPNHHVVTGGSVHADGYSFTLTNASFTGYSASGNGGTIYASFSNAPKLLSLDHITIKDSSANQGGAIFINSAENVVISHLTVENASSIGTGGAIYQNTGNLEISNSTFTGITAGGGNKEAGIYFVPDNKTMALVNVTLLMREGDYGVYYNKDNETAYVLNSILLGASKGDLRYNGTKYYVFGTLLGKTSMKSALDVTAASKNAVDVSGADVFGANQLVYVETEGFGTNGGGVMKMDADSAYKTYCVYTAKISDGSGYYYHDGSAWKNAKGGAYDAAKSLPYSVSQGGAERNESNVISGAYNQTAAAEKLDVDIVVESSGMNFVYGDYGTADGDTLEFIHTAGVFDIVYTVTVAFSSTSAAGMYKAGSYEITGVGFKEVRSSGVVLEQAEVDKYFSSITVTEGEGGNAKFTLAKQNITVAADRLEIVAGKTPVFTYSVLGKGLEAGDALALDYTVKDAAGNTVDHTKGETFNTVGDVFYISVAEGTDTEEFDNENYTFEFTVSANSTITVQEATRTYIVTTGTDVTSKTDGLLSLREAIVEANSSLNYDQVITIYFADSFTEDVILKGGLDITGKAQIVIDGRRVTVDDNGNITAIKPDEITLTRSSGYWIKVFNGTNVTFKDMTVDGRVTNSDTAMFQSSVTESASLQFDDVDIIDMRKGFDLTNVDITVKNNSIITNGGVGATYNNLMTVKNGILTIDDSMVGANKNVTLFNVTNGSLVITNSGIAGNYSTGTAIYLSGSDLILSGTYLESNGANILLNVVNGDALLGGVEFSYNAGKTAVIDTNNCNLTIVNGTFAGNGTDATTSTMKAINMAGTGKLTISRINSSNAYGASLFTAEPLNITQTVPLITLSGSVSAEISTEFRGISSLQSDANGAIIFSRSTGSIVFKDSVFTDIDILSASAKKGWVRGGAIYIDNAAASLSVIDSTFSNISIGGSYRGTVQGGVIYANVKNMEITGSVFENNTITETTVNNVLGGVVCHNSTAAGSSTVIADTVFSGNDIIMKNLASDASISGSLIHSNAENLTVTGTNTDVEFKDNLIDVSFSTAKKYTFTGMIYHDDSVGKITLKDLTFDGVKDDSGAYIVSHQMTGAGANTQINGLLVYNYGQYAEISGLTVQYQLVDMTGVTGGMIWNGMIRLNRPSIGNLPAAKAYDFSLSSLMVKTSTVNLQVDSGTLTVSGGYISFGDLHLASGSVLVDGVGFMYNTFSTETTETTRVYGGMIDFGGLAAAAGNNVTVTLKDINAGFNIFYVKTHKNGTAVHGMYVRQGMNNSVFNLLGENSFESNEFTAEIGVAGTSSSISDIQGTFYLGGGVEKGTTVNFGSSTDGGSLSFTKDAFLINSVSGIIHSHGGTGVFINGAKLTSYADITFDTLSVDMAIEQPSWYGYRYDVSGLLLTAAASELNFHKAVTMKNTTLTAKKTGDLAALTAGNKLGYRVRGGLICYSKSDLNFAGGLTLSGNELTFSNDLGGKIDMLGGLIGYDTHTPTDLNSFKVNDGGLAITDNAITLSGINNDTVESANRERFLTVSGGLVGLTGDLQMQDAVITGNSVSMTKTGAGKYECKINGGLIFWNNEGTAFQSSHLFDLSGTAFKNNTILIDTVSSQTVNGSLVYVGKQRFENSADLTNLKVIGNTLKTADTGFSGSGKFTVNGGFFHFEQRNDNVKFTADMSGSIFRDNVIQGAGSTGTFTVQGGVIQFLGQNAASDSLLLNDVYADGDQTNSGGTLNGGFLWADGSAIEIENSMFTGWTANQGGALYVTSGAMTATETRFSGNIAAIGGAVYMNNVTGGMENVVMTGNIANDEGGAIYFNTSSTTYPFSIVNSTITENNSGIYLRYSAAPLTILNSIIAWNTAYDLATHVYQPTSYGNLVIGNSVFTSADKVLKSLTLDDTSKFAESQADTVYKLSETQTYGEGEDTVTVSTAAYLVLQSGAAAGGALVYKDNGSYNTSGTGSAISTDINGRERTSPYVMGADARTVQTVEHVISEQTGAVYGDADLLWEADRTFGGLQDIQLNESLTISATMDYTLTYGDGDKSTAGYMNANTDGYAITSAALDTDAALTGAAYEDGLITVTENDVKTYFLVTVKLADSGAKYIIAKRALESGSIAWSGGKYTGNTYNSTNQFDSIKGSAELTSSQILAGDTAAVTITSGTSNFTDAGTHTAVISCTNGNYAFAEANTITGLTKDYVIDKAKITLTPAVASGETIKVDTNYVSVAQDKLDGFAFKCNVTGDTFDDDLTYKMVTKDGADFEVSGDTEPAVYEVRYMIDGSLAGNYEVTNADVYTRFIVIGTGTLSPDLSNQTISIGTYGDYTSANNAFATTIDTGDQFGLELTYALDLDGETLNTASGAYNAGTFGVNSAVLKGIKVDAGYTAEIQDGRIVISSNGDAVMIYDLDALKINGFQAKIDALALIGTITWNDTRTDTAKVYNGSTHSGGVTAAVSAENLLKGDALDFSYAFSSDKGDTEFIHAGTHTGSLVNNDTNYDFSGLTWTAGTDKFVVTPKVLTITGGITAQDRDYDGTTDVVINKYTVTNADGKVGSDELYVDAAGKFVAKDVVKDGKQTVNIETLTLTGSAAGDYLLAESGHQSTATAEIRAIDVTMYTIPLRSKNGFFMAIYGNI